MTTVAEQESVLRTDVAPGNPDWRARWPVNNLRERIQAAQERIREQNIARQSGDQNVRLLDQRYTLEEAASHLVYDLGLVNSAASVRFINQLVEMEKTIAAQAEIILALCTEVEALKRRKGYTPHAETR